MNYNDVFNEAARFEKLAGIFEGPSNLYNAIRPWAMNHYFSHTLQRAIEKDLTSPDPELKNLILALQKRGFKPSKYRNSISTKFPLQLVVNWKYLTTEEQQNAIKILKAKGWPDPMKFELYFSSKKFQGEFDNDKCIIRMAVNINVNNIVEFNKEFHEACDTLKHEIMHCGQVILADIKKISHGGFPFKKEKTNQNDQYLENSEDYYDDDSEFYPWLNHAIMLFNSNKYDSRKHQEDYFKDFINQTGREDYSHGFFAALKEKNPSKWNKAVKELYKNIKWIETDEDKKKSTPI